MAKVWQPSVENWLRDSTLKFSAEIRKKSEKISKSKIFFFSFLAILDHFKHFGKKKIFMKFDFPTLDC